MIVYIKPRAFTLLEVVISLALGAFIFSGLATFYFYHKQAYDYEQAMIEVTNNGLAASHVMRMLLDSAGYAGCLSLPSRKIYNHITHQEEVIAPIILFSQPLPHLSKKPLEGNSIVEINFLNPEVSELQADMISPHTLIIGEFPTIKSGDIVMISHCTQADIVKIDSVQPLHHQQIIDIQDELPLYAAGAFLGKWEQSILYVANTDRKDSLGQTISALYWQPLSGPEEELVAGVYDFHVQQNQKTGRVDVKFSTISAEHVLPGRLINRFQQHLQQSWQFRTYLE